MKERAEQGGSQNRSEERSGPPMKSGGEPAEGSTASKELTQAQRRALSQQDPETLALFYDQYFDRVYGYVRRLLRDDHWAEDVTQDIFMHIHKALPTYDASRELRPWVFTIATNKVRDVWNSRRFQESQRAADIDAAGSFAQELEQSDALSRLEDQEVVRKAIEEIPETLRVTLLLRAYEGFSFRQIAEHFDRSEVAVRKRYSRALQDLRERLEGRFEDEFSTLLPDPHQDDPVDPASSGVDPANGGVSSEEPS